MSDLHRRLDDLAARRRRQSAPAPRRLADQPQDLATALGGEICTHDDLTCWRIETPFEASCPTFSLSNDDFAKPRAAPAGSDVVQIQPDNAFVIDIETGGLWGAQVFLIGVVALNERPWRVVQWLARGYAEENAILTHLAHWIADRGVWVSFNGKSFDEPFVRERAVVHRLALPATTQHFDLLHAARRAWKAELPNCRLVTLEEHVLGRRRIGDVPSSDVPDLFHHFYKTGAARPLRPVLEHNRIDLISCVELLAQLTEECD